MNESVFLPSEILNSLVAHKVEFVLIGGYGIIVHGELLDESSGIEIYQTTDIDIAPDFSDENIERLCECLTSIDACPPGLKIPRRIAPSDFSEYKTSIFMTKFGRVDIVRTADAIGQYKDIVKTAEPVIVHGTEFLLASLQTIERSKTRAGRLKDRRGLHAIKRLKQAYRAKISSLRKPR